MPGEMRAVIIAEEACKGLAFAGSLSSEETDELARLRGRGPAKRAVRAMTAAAARPGVFRQSLRSARRPEGSACVIGSVPYAACARVRLLLDEYGKLGRPNIRHRLSKIGNKHPDLVPRAAPEHHASRGECVVQPVGADIAELLRGGFGARRALPALGNADQSRPTLPNCRRRYQRHDPAAAEDL